MVKSNHYFLMQKREIVEVQTKDVERADRCKQKFKKDYGKVKSRPHAYHCIILLVCNVLCCGCSSLHCQKSEVVQFVGTVRIIKESHCICLKLS